MESRFGKSKPDIHSIAVGSGQTDNSRYPELCAVKSWPLRTNSKGMPYTQLLTAASPTENVPLHACTLRIHLRNSYVPTHCPRRFPCTRRRTCTCRADTPADDDLEGHATHVSYSEPSRSPRNPCCMHSVLPRSRGHWPGNQQMASLP